MSQRKPPWGDGTLIHAWVSLSTPRFLLIHFTRLANNWMYGGCNTSYYIYIYIYIPTISWYAWLYPSRFPWNPLKSRPHCEVIPLKSPKPPVILVESLATRFLRPILTTKSGWSVAGFKQRYSVGFHVISIVFCFCFLMDFMFFFFFV